MIHYRQTALLQLALAERGRSDAVRVGVEDHQTATAWVGGERVGIVYPDSFWDRTADLFDTPKAVRFTFRGYVSKGRKRLLDLFQSRHGPVRITHTRAGRDAGRKATFDAAYFHDLATSEFGLCPDHLTWPGDPDGLWTYRFIECCMVGAIPVAFRRTPLGSAFTAGFRFRWDDDETLTYDPEDAAHNRALAEQRWRLP